jgi:hypothetical protein
MRNGSAKGGEQMSQKAKRIIAAALAAMAIAAVAPAASYGGGPGGPGPTHVVR